EPEELAISNGALYMVAATDDALYNNIQGDFVVNDVLYNSQNEFDVINDFLHGIDQDKYENGNMMNFEGAQHESTVVYNDWHQTISEAVPHIMFTDADPVLIAAIRDEFPTVNALHCMFHIAQNIPLNLKNSLKDRYNEFIKDFFEDKKTEYALFRASIPKTVLVAMANTILPN
ncbi:10705_t:CDS:2, partial [Racocetra fulgida]